MNTFRKRWLRPATWAVLWLMLSSFGCQTECCWNNAGRPVLRPACDQGPAPNGRPGDTLPANQPSGDGRPGVLPAIHQQGDQTLAAPIEPARGCGVPGGPMGPIPNLPTPTEKEMTAHPAYIIEPPDILIIYPVRLIPKPPYHIEPLDVLQVQVAEALPQQPISGPSLVSAEGVVNLGYGYGVVRVGGLTIEQAALAIRNQLKLSISNPQVSVTLLQFRGVQQTLGEHLVIQDGTITLGSYGSVFVTGMTLCQAKAAIERHLANFLQNPEISLSVNAYNSKVYYVITDGAGFGQTVRRLPITGKETVLDAISLNGGLAAVSSRRRIWLARPGPAGAPCYKILPVDWDAIVMGGDTTTNYQIFPGDRIFINSDCLIEINNALTKILAPVQQVLGITLLGASTWFTVNGQAFNNNNNAVIR